MQNLVQLTPAKANTTTSAVCLIMTPYFSPWANPLGITTLKSYLEARGHAVRCIDFNTGGDFWALHLEYFHALESTDPHIGIEGHSRLWSIRNAHFLAILNGAEYSKACQIVKQIAGYWGVKCDDRLASRLTDVVAKTFAHARALLEQQDLSKWSLVGMSSYSTSLALSLFFLKMVKERHPKIRTVMGGGLFADDCALGSDNLRVLLECFPYLDHVILGEGELLLAGLVEGKFPGQRVLSLKNLDGQTVPIDEVPLPNLGDLDITPYFHLTLEGGRSCPFQCSFCSETTQWGDYRRRSPELLAASMKQLAEKYSRREFFMADSLMNPYIERFSAELSKIKAGLLFDGYLRADPIATDERRTKSWAQSGCYRVRLGIESGSAKILGLMQKHTKPETISRALRSLSAAGIRTTTYWIVGFPGETEEDFQDTLRLIEENRESIYEVEAHPFYFYPYGQIASGRWSPAQVYPEEVTSLTRFGVWDVKDVDPPREERYRRLRRLATVARDLGILNIYTVDDRMKAEERWLGLHRTGVEVY